MGKSLNAGGIDRMTAGQTFTPQQPQAPAPAPVAAPSAADQHAQAPQAVAPVAAPQAAPDAAPVQFGGQTPETPAPAGPQAVAGAFAGAAVITSEPDVYRPGGEFSFVRDAFHANVDRDVEAATRLTRWRQQLESFAAVRAGFPEVIPPGYRPELMVDVIDRGRPIMSRLTNRITITDATPFKIPVEGEFTGVGDHVEGTAHVAPGTLTVDDATVTPKAISGAFEVSRELVDASNPAIDRIALNAMQRDYRRHTEAYAATQLVTGLDPVMGVDTGVELEAQLIDFLDDRDAAPAFIASSPSYFTDRATEQAGDGRARYPYLNPTNASGTTSAGFSGLYVQGVELVRAGQVTAGDAVMVHPDDVLSGESNLLMFQFNEVQGPGIIKLALWSYIVVKRVRDLGVRVVRKAAE